MLTKPKTTTQARWMAAGLWLLAILSLGLTLMFLEPEHLNTVYQDGDWNTQLLAVILSVSGINLTLIALADWCTQLEIEEEI